MNQMLNKLILFFFSGVCVIFTACSSINQHNNDKKNSDTSVREINLPKQNTSFENIEKGKILNNRKCRADTGNDYALYIPLSYIPSVSQPVIVFFDSHGAGVLPLKKYKDLADRYGYIFAGSNNSMNGNSTELNLTFGNNLINDLESRLNIDKRRIYTCGFSGGSRVAAAVAIFTGGINTVIGCGAGFPNIDKPIENKFNYIGIAGTEDFNFDEMQELEDLLKKSDVEHIFIPFNGKHEWCPVGTMDRAFTWLKFKAMKQNLEPKDDSIIHSFLLKEKAHIAGLVKNKKEEAAYAATLQTLNFISGLSDDKELSELSSRLENSNGVKKAKARMDELAKTEKSLKEEYLNAMALKDIPWWKRETQRLNDAGIFPPDQVIMNKRVLSFLSLACYMNINQMMKASQVNEAEHYVLLYKTIDPLNAEAPYLQAIIDLGKKNEKAALEQLELSAKLGFKEPDRFEKDFAGILNSAKGKEISVSIMKNMKEQ
jgi:hypothetical protein